MKVKFILKLMDQVVDPETKNYDMSLQLPIIKFFILKKKVCEILGLIQNHWNNSFCKIFALYANFKTFFLGKLKISFKISQKLPY